MDARLETQRDAAGQTIGARFTEEQRLLRRAPIPFAAEATTLATVTPRALVRIEGAVYSVWTRWAGLDLVVRVGPSTVTIVGRDGTRMHHPRNLLRQAEGHRPRRPLSVPRDAMAVTRGMLAALQSRRMPPLLSALRLLERHTVMKSALETSP